MTELRECEFFLGGITLLGLIFLFLLISLKLTLNKRDKNAARIIAPTAIEALEEYIVLPSSVR
jgi:hypothetical protein